MCTDRAAEPKKAWEKLKIKRLREYVWIAVVVLLLLILVFFAFKGEDEKSKNVMSQGTETEQKLAAILGEIEGVGEVQVMIGETEDGQKSVVVVCDGARSLQVIMDVREAAAAAVGTHQNQVKIYIRGNN